MPTALSALYTTKEEIVRRYGSVGVKSTVQDLTGTDTTEFWTELTSEASDVINTYCWVYYLPADLEDSRWVRSRATWIGCYLLSIRRGNPGLFKMRYDEIIDELREVAAGIIQIPELPTRGDFTPAMSNVRVEDGFRSTRVRVDQATSAGGIGSRQDISQLWPWYDF